MVVQPTHHRDRGATIPIVAILLPVLILMVAFAVDLGMQRSNRRTMQARADIIALDLVRLADGRTEDEILTDLDPSYATALAGTLDRNEVPSSVLIDVEYGTWDGVTFTGTLPDGVPSAVQVTATQTDDYFFQPGSGTVVRSAVATTSAEAKGELGSFAARASTSGSPLLGSVLGDALNTSVVGYDGLLSSDIDLGLLASELDLGTPYEVLNSDITVAELYHASAEAIRNDPDSDADDLANANLFDAVGTSLSGTGSMQLGDILAAEQGGEEGALTGTINAFDLFSAAALVANGENALAVPNLSLSAGLVQTAGPCNANPADDATEVCTALSLIQGPIQFGFGPIGTRGRTSQARTRLGATGGIPGLTSAATQLDVSVASADAVIQDITCGDPRTVRIGVGTGLADVSMRVTGRITVPLVLTSVSVPVTITLDRAPTNDLESVVFTEQSDGTWTPDPFEAGTENLGLTGVTATVNLDLTGLTPAVSAIVNTASGAILNPIIATITGPILTALDSATAPFFQQLGLNLAGADLSALGAECELPKLVD
jgi:uncharacterized membrane protein